MGLPRGVPSLPLLLSPHTPELPVRPPPVAMTPSPGPAVAMAQILPACSSNVLPHSPVRQDHSLTRPSAPQDST